MTQWREFRHYNQEAQIWIQLSLWFWSLFDFLFLKRYENNVSESSWYNLWQSPTECLARWVRNHSLALAFCTLTVQRSGLSRQCWSLVAQLQACPWASCVPFLILSLLICEPRISRVSTSWLRQCFWSKSPWESDNQYCSCNHYIITALFAQMINLMRRGL